MLEPRDSNIWALFLIFIVFPLVSYVLLGKWNETIKGKKRINFIATRATEEALLIENMAVGGGIRMVSMPNNGLHKCSKCFSTATTRCSQCKSVWYCSGRCQISHWRQVHKLECQPSENNSQFSYSKPLSLQDSCIKVSHGDATIKDNIHLQGSNKVTNHGITRMMGSMKSTKHDHRQHSGEGSRNQQKVKMLFPYEEFVKCFQLEFLNLSPRGLLNCGNSCYANAVLQCLTFTKPLITYLLRQSHSKTGCAKGWCLICELERHVMMLREIGCPLSTGNILMHIRSLNSQIGDGSQEDAHEFLRVIIASMQSICLESLGGEKVVDPRLQDTTFVQHTFGGCLKSKVKCLICHQESVRHENIMDLTLEIFGWVESLEDALTQFTSSEDLDGENKYRCGRCSSYVRARKKLSIKEAPNILTIVLKRFQEGNYGKLNKRITFPEILDMIPFMTGKDDTPPPYMLYAVVVHLNTSNESSSGHYISYVKDLRGNWFRIDDAEVLPAQLNQVMSERAYILFYIRSHPRPFRGHGRKATCEQSLALPKSCCMSKPEKSAQSKLSSNIIGIDAYLDHRLETNTENSRATLVRESRRCSKFSDATSSDWSVFTSSDDASFSTESTRDSLSTVDHSDVIPFSSIFQSLYAAESTYHMQLVSQQ